MDKHTVQVLVAAMNQTDHSLLDKMNIDSDVIVGNQCTFNSIEKFMYKSHNAVYLNFNERGVGLNRNNSLIRATGDICLFADDDMRYVDNYVEKIESAFDENPDADVIVFNLIEKNPTRYIIKKAHRVTWFNYLRYGTARISIRLDKIKKNAIYFNQCFGGGTDYSHGEDNLFLTSCLKNKMKIYALPIELSKSYGTEIKRHRLLVNSKLYVIKQWYNASIVTYVLALIMSRISLVEIGLWSLVHKR